MSKFVKEILENAQADEGSSSAPPFNFADINLGLSDDRSMIFINRYDQEDGVFVNREYHDIGNEAWEILVESEREIFQKGGILVSPAFDEHNNVRLVEYNIEKMTGLLSEEITFIKLRFSKGEVIPEIIPIPNRHYASYILRNCDHSVLPPVHACLNHPFVCRHHNVSDIENTKNQYVQNVNMIQGYMYEIINDPGLHWSGVYLNPRKIIKIQIYKNLEEADFILEDIFRDFPYESRSSLCNTIGQLISGLMRFALGSNMPPIALTTSQTHGSGKTLETDTIHAILYGTTANWSSRISTLDEYRKTLLTHAIAGDPMVCFDNLNERLNIEALASAATAGRISGRILHTMSNVTVDNYMQICINGTSLEVSTEIADRTIWKVMATHQNSMDRHFKYTSLIDGQVIPNRAAILSALFTYIQKWIDRGCPVSFDKAELHRSKVWASVIGGVLTDTIWGEEFLTNTKQQRIQADTTYVRWCHAMRELAEYIGVPPDGDATYEFNTKDAFPICSYFDRTESTDDDEGDILPDITVDEDLVKGANMLGEDIGLEVNKEQSRRVKLGMIFRSKGRNNGTPFGDWLLVDAGQKQRLRYFRLEWIRASDIPEKYYKSDANDRIPF